MIHSNLIVAVQLSIEDGDGDGDGDGNDDGDGDCDGEGRSWPSVEYLQMILPTTITITNAMTKYLKNK